MHAPLCCERIEIGLPEYLDRALPAPIRLRFDSHLAVCVECWHELQRLQRVRMLMESLPRLEMPHRVRRRLLQAIARTPPTPAAATRP